MLRLFLPVVLSLGCVGEVPPRHGPIDATPAIDAGLGVVDASAGDARPVDARPGDAR